MTGVGQLNIKIQALFALAGVAQWIKDPGVFNVNMPLVFSQEQSYEKSVFYILLLI